MEPPAEKKKKRGGRSGALLGTSGEEKKRRADLNVGCNNTKVRDAQRKKSILSKRGGKKRKRGSGSNLTWPRLGKRK